MTVQYPDTDSFHDGILAMVTRGLCFQADAGKLTITLTGGY